jgi:hypothetical protein
MGDGLFHKGVQAEILEELRWGPEEELDIPPLPRPTPPSATPKRVEIQSGCVTLAFAKTSKGIRCVSKTAPAGTSTFVSRARFLEAHQEAIKEFARIGGEVKKTPRMRKLWDDF